MTTRNWEGEGGGSETLNGERDTFARTLQPQPSEDLIRYDESIDDRRDRPMIDRRWIEALTLGLNVT